MERAQSVYSNDVSSFSGPAGDAGPVRRTTTEHVADVLREWILRGRFEDGEELNQAVLAKQFGTARVPIREALRQLQGEGLVEARAHHRSVVRAYNRDRLLEMVDVRCMVEAYLLERAVSHLTDSDFDRLESLWRQMERLKNHQKWLLKNREFHDALYGPSGAEFAINLSRQLSRQVERYLHIQAKGGVQRNREANSEHRRILDAARRRDVRGAVAELERHVMQTRQRIDDLTRAGSPRDGD